MAAGGLTPREIECLRLVLERLTDQQIADRLGISRSRVSNSLGAAYRKLDIHDRMRAATRAGILYPGTTMPGAAGVETRSPELAPTDGRYPPTDGETTSVPWLLAPYRRKQRAPPRLFGSLLPMILGWTLLGLVIMAVFVGLLNAVFGSGDPYARRVDATMKVDTSMNVVTNLQEQSLSPDRKAVLGGVVAHSLQEAEANLDAFIGSLGRGLAEMAGGRAQAGLRASQCQSAFERYAGVIADSAALRGALIRTHATFARDGRRAGVDWTAFGPTEPTPDKGEEDGPIPRG